MILGVERVAYFAYGSNLLGEQMRERCPSAREEGLAVLEEHALVFDVKGAFRPGAVANVRATPGSTVHGRIWGITHEDLLALDVYERAYSRSSITVLILGGGPREVLIYQAPGGENSRPTTEYLELIRAGAAEAGLPENYRLGIGVAAG